VDVSGQTERLCLLAMPAGREEVCASEDCPLWENGSCALENLPPDGEPDERPYGLVQDCQVQSLISG
jgi:hypothetical protein